MKKVLTLSALFALLQMASAAFACNGPINCTIQTVNGRYLTAVGGGGRTTDVIHTDARRAQAWEKFTLVDSCSGDAIIDYGIKTSTGNYLTAVGGGNKTTDVIHSDATQLQAWEKFKFISLGNSWYAIKTNSGNYLTAVGGGGKIVDAIHTDATQVKSWEKFRVICGP